jgi:hypothetical protein
MQRGRIFLGSTCVFSSSETRRKRDHTKGDEGREVSGALLFMVSDLFQGLSVRRRCERASEADNERDVFSFFERERDNRRILKDSDFQYAPEHSLQQDTE